MSSAFVIHLHRGHGADHYDLMLEDGGALATWQLGEFPAGLTPGASLPARRIQDHRIHYLDYQGPVSRDRGQITMSDKGIYRLILKNPARWIVQFAGRELTGGFELSLQQPPDGWVLTRIE